MDGTVEHDVRLLVRGGNRLDGEIALSGAKNSALKLLAASLLTAEPCVIRRVPRITDVATMVAMLRALGADVAQDGDELRVHAHGALQGRAPYELVRTMRASIIVMGPLVARLGEAAIALPGGCNIGPRRIDFTSAAWRSWAPS
jgi:UDP-N-acetylglucosamine 1-carboxyvinyltransferase